MNGKNKVSNIVRIITPNSTKLKKESRKDFNQSIIDFDIWKAQNLRHHHSKEIQSQNENKSSIDFDINNLENYKILIEGLTTKDRYLREYGNTNNIEWDYEILREVFSIMINKFEEKLKQIQLKDDYSVFNIARSYFYNIMCYAVINQKAVVDYQSLLSTFKDWNYLPFRIKFDMATTIITDLNLEDVKHPYLSPPTKREKSKEKVKIYQFYENN